MSIAATCIVKEYKSFGHMSEGVSANLLLAKNSLITIRYNQISSKLRKLRSDEVHMYYVQYKDLGF